MNKPLVNEHMGGGRKESGERQAGRNKLRARLMVHVEGSVCRVRSAEPGLQGRCSTVSPGSSGGCSNLGNVDFLSYPSTPPSPNPNRAVMQPQLGVGRSLCYPHASQGICTVGRGRKSGAPAGPCVAGLRRPSPGHGQAMLVIGEQEMR